MTALTLRGEVWWCEIAEIGRRPVVVLSCDAVISRHRRALVAPCTTTIRGLVGEVGLEPGEDPEHRRCEVSMDSDESVSVAVLVERLGRLAGTRMADLRSPRGRLRGLTLSRPPAEQPRFASRTR